MLIGKFQKYHIQGKQLIIPLHKVIYKPHLEYCIQTWRLYCMKDVDMLERIQRRETYCFQN